MNKIQSAIIFTLVIYLGVIPRISNAEGCCVEKNKPVLTLHCKGCEEFPNNVENKEGVIKSLDMSEGNKISQLNNNDLNQPELVDITKLTMSNCELRQIEDNALTPLKGLTDLDLSHNHIKDLTLQIFSGNTKLIRINLGNNKNLSELRGEFPEILTLKTIDLRSCNLSRLHEKTFQKVTSLETLYLNGNKFKTLSPQLTIKLNRLTTMTLANNPWNCNCHLRELVKKQSSAKSISANTEKPMCVSPPEFANQIWESVDSDKFYCDPKIEKIQVNEKVVLDRDIESQIFNYESGDNITVICEIWADPPADINWRKDDISVVSNERHNISFSHSEADYRTRISKLTIVNCEVQDTGNYQCHAENRGHAVNYTAVVNITAPFIPPPILSGGNPSRVWLWVLIGIGSALLVAIIVGFIFFIIWRRNHKRHKILRKEVMKKFKGSQDVLDVENKEDSSKQDKVPLLKEHGNGTPTSVPSMSVSGTETASFSHIDFRSPEQILYQQPHMQRSVPPSPSIYGRMVPSRPGSSQSVFLDNENSRHMLQHSTKIDLMSFDAVRYHNRPPSVDSFMSLPAPETHRLPNGYVTLPRKPRNPRWSTSTAIEDKYSSVGSLGRPTSSSSQQPMGMYSTLPYKRQTKRRPTILAGPHYDAVGPRTTVDGSSTLSLNKIGGGSMSALDSINSALNTSPTRGKVVMRKSRTASATTPGTGRPSHNSFSFEPIEEVESTPATSEININIKPKMKDDSNNLGKYKKKKPPNLDNLNRIKTPSNFHQRISEINKSFERPKSASDILGTAKETEISDTTDSESSAKKIPQKPPPKPLRTLSAPEYNDSSSVMFGVIHEEVEGTAV